MGDDMNFSLTTFDKSGKLNQIEYALNRVAQGKMSLGIKAKNGVVIATDKKVQVRLPSSACLRTPVHVSYIR
jgi:20S proteasome subunit alpha 2